MDLQELRQQLLADKLTHFDMIDCIDRGFAQVVKADDRGVLLYSTGCDQYHLTAKEPEFVRECMALCQPGRNIICHQEFLLEELCQQLKLFHMAFHHGVYTGKQPPPQRGDEPEIRQLGPEWVDQVSPHYYDDSEKILLRARMEEGRVFGAFIDNQLAGFIGEHSEGTYGILEVIPQFRRRGVAYALERHIIAHLMAQGRVPYCQVKSENAASLALQSQLGVEVSPGLAHWLFA